MVFSNVSLFMLVVCTLNTSQKVLGVKKLEMENIRACENRCDLAPTVKGKKITCDALINADETTRKELCKADATTEKYGDHPLHRYYPKTCRPSCRIGGQCEDFKKLEAKLEDGRVLNCDDLKAQSKTEVNALCETNAKILNKNGAVYKLKRVCRKTCRARECKHTKEKLGNKHIEACENKCALEPMVGGKKITCADLNGKDKDARNKLCNSNATTEKYGEYKLHIYYPKTCRSKCRLEGQCKDYDTLRAVLSDGSVLSCKDLQSKSQSQMNKMCEVMVKIKDRGDAKYKFRRVCPKTCRAQICKSEPKIKERLGDSHIKACVNKCNLEIMVGGKKITCTDLNGKDDVAREKLCKATARTEEFGDYPLHMYYPKTCRQVCRVEGGCYDHKNLEARFGDGSVINCQDLRSRSTARMNTMCSTMVTIEKKGVKKGAYSLSRLCPKTCRSQDCNPGGGSTRYSYSRDGSYSFD